MSATSSATPASAGADLAFSDRLRQATRSDHRNAEHSHTMTQLLRGDLTLEAYALLLAQLHAVYTALEEASDQLGDDPTVRRVAAAPLRRRPALDHDLTVVAGSDWRDRLPVLPATARYTERLREVARDPGSGRFVAHHYTRYLGDLSGGQHIGRVVRETYGFSSDRGARYYHFDLEDIDAFKAGYRAALDEAPWSASDQAAIIDETRLAYRLNIDLFAGLDATRDPAGP